MGSASKQLSLPRTDIFNFHEADEGEEMEFHLLYQGPLRSEGGSDLGSLGRAEDKHKLRKHFHPQLRELWNQEPYLRWQASKYCRRRPNEDRSRYVYQFFQQDVPELKKFLKKYIDWVADDHQRCNARFVPLVSKLSGFTCSLDILFLRRDNPGSMIQSGGDIDNRIKVLLDGLRMPNSVPELGGITYRSSGRESVLLLT
jgi:hypothetical protein